MQEIKFIKGETSISFVQKQYANYLASQIVTKEFTSFSLPRENDWVEVCGTNGELIEGRVRCIEWYYTAANHGPVVFIYLK